jgi:hypothetical protein
MLLMPNSVYLRYVVVAVVDIAYDDATLLMTTYILYILLSLFMSFLPFLQDPQIHTSPR